MEPDWKALSVDLAKELESTLGAFYYGTQKQPVPEVLSRFYSVITAEQNYLQAVSEQPAKDLWDRSGLKPIPVSERLPGPEDCDAEGHCWWWRTDGIDAFWEFIILRDPVGHNLRCGGKVSYGPWLPHYAISRPDSKEIQQ